MCVCEQSMWQQNNMGKRGLWQTLKIYDIKICQSNRRLADWVMGGTGGSINFHSVVIRSVCLSGWTGSQSRCCCLGWCWTTQQLQYGMRWTIRLSSWAVRGEPPTNWRTHASKVDAWPTNKISPPKNKMQKMTWDHAKFKSQTKFSFRHEM